MTDRPNWRAEAERLLTEMRRTEPGGAARLLTEALRAAHDAASAEVADLQSAHAEELAALRAEYDQELAALREPRDVIDARGRELGAKAENARVLAILALGDSTPEGCTFAPPDDVSAKLLDWAGDPGVSVEQARSRYAELAAVYDAAARRAGLEARRADEAALDAPTGWFHEDDRAAAAASIRNANDFAAQAVKLY